MSLARAALRLATVLALTDNATEPWPTLAEGRVYDSRLDPKQLFANAERRPIAVVYTDHDAGNPRSAMTKGPPLHRTIDLVVEVSVVTEIEDPETREPVLVSVQTDAELEVWLDLIEHQTRAHLFYGTSPWASLWRGFFTRVRSIDSHRQTDQGDGGVRFAMRKLVISIDMPDDCPPATEILGPGAVATPPGLPQAIQALLDAIAAAGASSDYVASLAAIVAAAGVPGHLSLPMLERVRFTEAAQAVLQGGVAAGPRAAGVAESDLS